MRRPDKGRLFRDAVKRCKLKRYHMALKAEPISVPALPSVDAEYNNHTLTI